MQYMNPERKKYFFHKTPRSLIMWDPVSLSQVHHFQILTEPESSKKYGVKAKKPFESRVLFGGII